MNISIILFLLLLITPIFRGGPRKFIRGPPGSGRGSQRQEDQHEDDAVGGGSRTGTSNQGNTRSGDTTTGTNHQDVATGSGMPSSQGEPQQNPFELQGLGDPFFNIQFDPSFQPFPVEDYYPPIYPPSYYQINQPAQQTNPTFFENENFNIWPENIQQDVSTTSIPVQADSISKDKRPKQKGSQKERAFKKIKELGYTLQEIEVLSFGNKIRGKCNLCKDYNEREFGFEINNQKGVEECIDNHVNSQNHQLAMEHIKKPENEKIEKNKNLQQLDQQSHVVELETKTEPSKDKEKGTKKERVLKRIKDLGFTQQIYIKKMGRALSICYCNLCKHQFQIKDEEGIDLHLKTEEHILNAMDAIKKKEEEKQNLQPSYGQESYPYGIDYGNQEIWDLGNQETQSREYHIGQHAGGASSTQEQQTYHQPRNFE